MQEVSTAVGLGAATGLLTILAVRAPLAWLGWLMLGPLAVALYLFPPLVAALAGLTAGALYTAVGMREIKLPVSFAVIMTGIAAATWGLVSALAAWLWPDGVPAWGAVIVPAGAFLLSAAMRFGALPGQAGAVRYADPFLRSQELSLPVVHIARLGSDLVIAPLLALAATVPVLLLVHFPPSGASEVVAAISILAIGGALAFGFASYRRAVRRLRAGEAGESVRVAAVSADATFEGYSRSPAYRDVDARIRQFEPLVARAIAGGARLIVLPEHAVIVTPETRERWLAALSGWAKKAGAPVVSGVFDTDLQHGQLLILDETGAVAATYEKQHPMMGSEPKREARMHPALLDRDPFPVSGVVCCDMDFNDLVRPVARAGGILAVPANDWKGAAEELHHQSSVWPVVMAGVPLVRATGHGVSAVYDAAGEVLAQANSFDGPVVLLADVPTMKRPSKTSRQLDRQKSSTA
jgi:apolipoprotein N-acyltransferase